MSLLPQGADPRPRLPARASTLCAVCHRFGNGLICAACVARHTPSAVLRCPRCALRVASSDSSCAECALHVPPQRYTVCAADYAFPWDGLLRALKFHQHIELAGPLAALLSRAIDVARAPAPRWVVPVPLSAQRLAERGYNQAWLIARRLAARRGIAALPDALLRLADTREQAGLPRAERLTNLRSAFGVAPVARAALAGATVALVDDVVTTGATAAACTRALLAAGVADVSVWAVARTPAD